jgi:hypothetical protein
MRRRRGHETERLMRLIEGLRDHGLTLIVVDSP